MTKPFLTYEQMIERLKKRGLVIDEEDLDILKKENYYSLINGYKDPFLNKRTKSERFIKGTSLQDIYGLFLFDKELRFLLLRYLVDIETTMKSLIAHRASEHYQADQEFYLKNENYTGEQKSVETTIRILKKQRNNKHHSIVHYREKYESVPFWVLVKHTTFGDISFFYELIKPSSVRAAVAKDLAELQKANAKERRAFTPLRIKREMRILVDFRNACAHNERIYSRVSGKVNAGGRNSSDQPVNIYTLIEIMCKYLQEDSAMRMNRELSELILGSIINRAMKPSIARYVLNSMGYPQSLVSDASKILNSVAQQSFIS